MADPIRKQILDALESAVAGILSAAGYNRDITTVEVKALHPDHVPTSQLDWVGIIPQSEAFRDRVGDLRSAWSIDIACGLAADASTPAGIVTAASEFAADLRKALYQGDSGANLGVDGVEYVRLVNRRGFEADIQVQEGGVAFGVFGIEVVFYEVIV